MRLLKVGRALQDRQITPERAEMLEGLLDSLIPSAGGAEQEASAKVQPAPQSPPPYRGGFAANEGRLPVPRVSPPATPQLGQRHTPGNASSPPMAQVVCSASSSKTPGCSSLATPAVGYRGISAYAGALSSPPQAPVARSRQLGKEAQTPFVPSGNPASRSRGAPGRVNSMLRLRSFAQDTQQQPYSARGSRQLSPAGRPQTTTSSGASTPRRPQSGSYTPSYATPRPAELSPRGQYQLDSKPAFKCGLHSSSRVGSLARRGGC